MLLEKVTVLGTVCDRENFSTLYFSSTIIVLRANIIPAKKLEKSPK